MSNVTEYLEREGIPFTAIEHDPAYTARAEARSLGLPPDAVAKTVVLYTGSGPALAVVPGSARVDLRLARAATNDPGTRLATEREIERDFPGFELGAIPPLGSLLSAPVYVDPEIAGYPNVLLADRRDETVRMRTEDLIAHERATVAPLAQRTDPFDRAW